MLSTKSERPAVILSKSYVRNNDLRLAIKAKQLAILGSGFPTEAREIIDCVYLVSHNLMVLGKMLVERTGKMI